MVLLNQATGENRLLWAAIYAVSVACALIAAHYARPKLSLQRIVLSMTVPIAFMIYGLGRRSLSVSGAVVGWVVACAHGLTSPAVFIDLTVFFVTGSRLTRFRANVKRVQEEDYKEGGQRDWVQVLCNGGPAAVLSIAQLVIPFHPNVVRRMIACSLCAYACCCGDTWASEIGSVVAHSSPRLVTSWKTVPAGTNGGVTHMGLLASIAGGALIGLSHGIATILFDEPTTISMGNAILLGTTSGFVGSIIDSILGATCQYSGWDKKRNLVVNSPQPGVVSLGGKDWLSNHMVNLISVSLTAAVVPFLWPS